MSPPEPVLPFSLPLTNSSASLTVAFWLPGCRMVKESAGTSPSTEEYVARAPATS